MEGEAGEVEVQKCDGQKQPQQCPASVTDGLKKERSL